MSNDHDTFVEMSECEHTHWVPKYGELCLKKMKLGGTLVEVCSGSGIQIDH